MMKHPLETVQDLCLKLQGRIKNRAQTAVLSQVHSINVSFENISLRYEDTYADRACASGGAKIGKLRMRLERNDQKLLSKAADFRVKSAWHTSTGDSSRRAKNSSVHDG